MAEKKKILFIVEAMGGGVFTYIVDLANELVKEYKKHEKNILKDFNVYEVLSNEIKMDRLYFSKKINGYASVEYVMLNG